MKIVFLSVLIIFSILPVFSVENGTCMECHSDKDITKEVKGSEHSVFVDVKTLKNSVHSDFNCVDCHKDADIKDFPHKEELKPVKCSGCHDDILDDYKKSIHAVPLNVKGVKAAGCKDCHGTHNIMSSDQPQSLTNNLNIQITCGNCHNQKKILDLLNLKGDGPVKSYSESIHNRYLHLKNSKLPAPTCVTCHGSHLILKHSDPNSKFSKKNIKDVCGNCHKKEHSDYLRSIHWKALELGIGESPNCNDCHGEHKIISVTNKDALTYRLNEGSQICNSCHSSKVLMQRVGLDPNRFKTYMKTYHGLALLRGSLTAATCTSCHEVHSIMKEGNPDSSVNKKNLLVTCRKCHKEADESFITIPVHPSNTKERNFIAYVVKEIYIYLILLVIGAMFIHNMIIYIHYVRKKFRNEKNEKMYRKFQSFEIFQHASLIISFFMLVITGFALKFPNSFFADLLSKIGLTEFVRSTIHRIFAVVLILLSVIQVIYLVFTRKGRKDIKALLPGKSDIVGLVGNMKFYLFKSSDRPKSGKFDYIEKAEYLALIWGTLIMIITGFILWFPEFFIRFLPWWSFEVAEVIHLLEAILATLAIIVWHFFFVIFNPEVYPIKTTWRHGRIPESELEHKNPGTFKDEELPNE